MGRPMRWGRNVACKIGIPVLITALFKFFIGTEFSMIGKSEEYLWVNEEVLDCNKDGSLNEMEAFYPDLDVVDTEVHFNDLSKMPRRGSVVFALVEWIPSSYYRSLLTSLVSFPQKLQIALNGANGEMQHVVEPFNAYTLSIVSKNVNVSGFVAVESTPQLSPRGQETNSQVHLFEARWLLGQSPAVIAYGGGEKLSSVEREQYLKTLSTLRGIKGVRWTIADSPSPVYHSWASFHDSRRHRRGLEQLMDLLIVRGITVLEIVAFHDQLGFVASIASQFPAVKVVLVNAGGPLLCGRPLIGCKHYKTNLETASKVSNIFIKISGLGAVHTGLGYNKKKPSWAQLEADWKDIIVYIVGLFGKDRVLFGSNFPFDQPVFSYEMFWTTMKRIIAEAYEGDESTLLKLFRENALQVYGPL
mmetsp:Transcript_2373/g.4634  ORF Transcript_2373/g.4634 Transcript_2373/m.4634 type:complete len:416 (-) Transcript_2373:194-1441(-)